MLQNSDMPTGFCGTSNIANVAGIQNYGKCCRTLICLVDFAEHQILQMLERFKNAVNVAEY